MSALVWKETSPGQYERDLDEVEQFYTTLAKVYSGTGRTFFAITAHISFSVRFLEADTISQVEDRVEASLRKAWNSLRYDHPTLASMVKYDSVSKKCKKVYDTFPTDDSGAAESAWLEKTFRKYDSGQTGDEFCNSDPPIDTYPTIFLITPPTSGEDVEKILKRDIVFRSHHDIIDGIGTLHLLHNLFKHAASAYEKQEAYPLVTFGDEYKNLSPSLCMAVENSCTPSRVEMDRMSTIKSQNEKNRQYVDLIHLPFKANRGSPQSSQRTSVLLTALESRTLLEKCRAVGVTLTQALHAGIALALGDMQERRTESRVGRYISYVLLNLRGRCTRPYNTAEHAVSVYHSASGADMIVDISIPASTSSATSGDFHSAVHQVKEFYDSVRQDTNHMAMVPLYFSAITPTYPESDVPPPIPDPNERPSVSLSSLGVVDRILDSRYGPFEVDRPWVMGEELGNGLGVFLGTWRGSIEIAAGFNTAWWEAGEVKTFLEGCKGCVFEGLGVEAG
jgi:hypothetical protein